MSHHTEYRATSSHAQHHPNAGTHRSTARASTTIPTGGNPSAYLPHLPGSYLPTSTAQPVQGEQHRVADWVGQQENAATLRSMRGQPTQPNQDPGESVSTALHARRGTGWMQTLTPTRYQVPYRGGNRSQATPWPSNPPQAEQPANRPPTLHWAGLRRRPTAAEVFTYEGAHPSGEEAASTMAAPQAQYPLMSAIHERAGSSEEVDAITRVEPAHSLPEPTVRLHEGVLAEDEARWGAHVSNQAPSSHSGRLPPTTPPWAFPPPGPPDDAGGSLDGHGGPPRGGPPGGPHGHGDPPGGGGPGGPHGYGAPTDDVGGPPHLGHDHGRDVGTRELMQQMLALTQLMASQQLQNASATPAAPSVGLARVHAPPVFTGKDARAVRAFVTKCQTAFEFHRMVDPHQRVLYAASHFSDHALNWYENLQVRDPMHPTLHDWPRFCEELQATFGEPYPVFSAQGRLYRIRMQPYQRIVDFTAEFMIDAPVSQLGDFALAMLYYEGLPTRLKNEVTRQGRPEMLDPLVSLATRIDRTYWEQREADRPKQPAVAFRPQYSSTTDRAHPEQATARPPQPATLARPTKERRPDVKEERRRKGLCWYCGSDKHLQAGCEEYLRIHGSKKGNAARVTEGSVSSTPPLPDDTGESKNE